MLRPYTGCSQWSRVKINKLSNPHCLAPPAICNFWLDLSILFSCSAGSQYTSLSWEKVALRKSQTQGYLTTQLPHWPSCARGVPRFPTVGWVLFVYFVLWAPHGSCLFSYVSHVCKGGNYLGSQLQGCFSSSRVGKAWQSPGQQVVQLLTYPGSRKQGTDWNQRWVHPSRPP